MGVFKYDMKPILSHAPPRNATIAVWSTGMGTSNASRTIAAAEAMAVHAITNYHADLVLFSEAFAYDGRNAEVIPGGPILRRFQLLAATHSAYLAVPLRE